MRTLFVTATGTGIGKTFITQALIAQSLQAGRRPRALKPVVTGFTTETIAESDTAQLLDALGEPATADAVERMSPFRYAPPLAPAMAAARESRPLSVDALFKVCADAAAGPEDDLFIEGVGGVMVPLDGPVTVLDWIAAAGAPALLVTGSYLGTLSHTLTALVALESRRIPVAAIAVSESVPDTVGLDETVAALRSLVSAPVRAVPRLSGPRAWTRVPALDVFVRA